MLRLVLDTNILIAALIRKNTSPYQLYKAWRNGEYELVSSQAQLGELERVLRYAKLQRYFSAQEAREMLHGIATYSIHAADLPEVRYSPDPDDNLILATAIAAKADYIVSGDKAGMLALVEIQTIPLVTARRAVEILEISRK